MMRRLSSAIAYTLATTSLLFATLVVLAQTPAPAEPKPGDMPTTTKELRGSQEQNAKIFQELTRGLLTLAQRLEKSDRPEDKERAKTIYAALEHAQKASIDMQFKTLIGGLSKGSDNPQDIGNIKGQNQELIKSLIEMINILQTDDESERLRKEIATLEKFLKEAEALKRKTEAQRAMAEFNKGDPTKQANTQRDLAEQTKDLAERMGGKKGGDSGPKPEPNAVAKSDPKPGESAAEPKGDSSDPKAEPKDGSGDAKDPKDGSKSAEGKPGDKDSKAGESKSGEPKVGEAGQPKGMGEPKEGEPKEGEPKASDPKAGSEAKPASSKDASQGKGASKPSEGQPNAGEGKGQGSEPMPGGEQQAQSKPGQSGQPGQPGQPGQQQAQKPQTPGRKQVEEAYPHQKGAEDELRKPDNKSAAKQQDKAIEKLAQAIEELKKKLKQLREEEMLKTLAALEARCSRMLSMQIEVYEGTKVVHASIVKNGNEKTTADHQKSQQLGDRENEIVAEAQKAMKLLESEGSAVAFASVLEEVMGDMQAVQKRLAATWVDTDTQLIEENIISMLKDMIAALKKAQQEIQNSQQNPSPPGDGKPPPKALIDLLAELKLIRAFQTQVNTRTKMYATKYTGEQAADPIIQNELRQIAQRQAKLQDMIQKIATGANQ